MASLKTGLREVEFSTIESDDRERREWLRYLKPLGPSININATLDTGGTGFCIAGNRPGPCEEAQNVKTGPKLMAT